MKQTDTYKSEEHRRCNGFGSLYIRGDIYWARWVYHGKTYARSTKIRTSMVNEKGNPCGREIAEKILNAFTEPYRHQEEADVLALISRRITEERNMEQKSREGSKIIYLSDLADMFKNSPRRNDITNHHLGAYISECEAFAKWADPTRRANSITDTEAAEWAQILWKAGIAPHTFNTKIVMLRQIWQVLMPEIGQDHNPWANIKKKKKEASTRRALTDNEVVAIHKAAGDKYGGDLDILLHIGENTGMRLSDCAMLTWEHIDFKEGFIRVKTHKTGEYVSVPMLEDFKQLLLTHQKNLNAEYSNAKKMGWKKYWLSRPAKNIKDRDSNIVDEKYTKYVCPRMAERCQRDRTLLVILCRKTFMKAGIKTAEKVGRCVHKRPTAGFHSFRHRFASKLAAAGVSERLAMQLLGHRSNLIHEHYVHQDEEVLKKEITKLSRKKE